MLSNSYFLVHSYFFLVTASSQLDALDEDKALSTLNGGSPVPSLAVTEGDYGESSSRLDTSRSTLIE